MTTHLYRPDPTLIPGLRDSTITQIVVEMEEQPQRWSDGSLRIERKIPFEDGMFGCTMGNPCVIRFAPYQTGDTLEIRSTPPKDFTETVWDGVDFTLTVTDARAVQVSDITSEEWDAAGPGSRIGRNPSDDWVWLFTVERIEG